MKRTGWKMVKWPLFAALAVVVLIICSGWTHDVHQVREVHVISRGEGPFMQSRVIHLEQGMHVRQVRESFDLAGMLVKIGLLLIGALLFAKGKSVLKWGGGLLALLALWSLLSLWTIVLAAAAVAVFVYFRRRLQKNPERGMHASADWLAASAPQHDVHILDQWERQLTKEANN
ncbi:hypothetical protein [Paenibacillus silvisoli]|uniref:hypothetical protein n=1 Tax=Paenibacillus silvisoli TaxID=3110539 RepID=UPI002804DE6E|nr:hypothetical protein [Paenibacillus silvisoli]